MPTEQEVTYTRAIQVRNAKINFADRLELQWLQAKIELQQAQLDLDKATQDLLIQLYDRTGKTTP